MIRWSIRGRDADRLLGRWRALLELIEPWGDDSPVTTRVRKSPGLFHLCFEVDDLEETLRRLEAAEEARVIKPPQPAPAIENRRVAFVVTTGNDLIEFVERERT